MRAVGSGSLRDLAIVGALLGAVALPVACAHGSDSMDFGSPGAGGHTASTGATFATVTATGTGHGGATSTGNSPDGVTVGTNTTTSSGFATSSSGFATSSSGFATSSSGFATSVSSSSGGPSSVCDGTGDCSLCGECAQCDVCFNQTLDCEFDPDCSEILCCIANCGPTDQVCFNDCITSDPAGEQLFTDFYDCLVCACQSDCAVPSGTCP